MVAITSGGETSAACGALEWFQFEMDAQVTLEVAQLPHLFVTNSALEDVSVHASSFLADVCLTYGEAHDVGFRLDPLVIEDDRRPLGVNWASKFCRCAVGCASVLFVVNCLFHGVVHFTVRHCDRLNGIHQILLLSGLVHPGRLFRD